MAECTQFTHAHDSAKSRKSQYRLSANNNYEQYLHNNVLDGRSDIELLVLLYYNYISYLLGAKQYTLYTVSIIKLNITQQFYFIDFRNDFHDFNCIFSTEQIYFTESKKVNCLIIDY